MGYDSYSVSDRSTRADLNGYATKSTQEIFKQRTVNNAMNPFDVKMRESRDSKDHPNTLAIVLALDVTGSMGSIPHFLIKEGLPDIMGSIIKSGIKDPQVLFLGVGDHECDSAPLQIGQFESGDELLDKWLTDIWLESGGGGNEGESYLLAWYFALKHTTIDCLEKRGQKGILFTIGDEPALKDISKTELKKIMGNGQYDNYSTTELLGKVKEMYDVYHIHMKQGSNGQREEVIDGWKQLLGNSLRIAERKEDVSKIIVDIVKKHNKVSSPSEEPEKIIL